MADENDEERGGMEGRRESPSRWLARTDARRRKEAARARREANAGIESASSGRLPSVELGREIRERRGGGIGGSFESCGRCSKYEK